MLSSPATLAVGLQRLWVPYACQFCHDWTMHSLHRGIDGDFLSPVPC